MDTLGQGRFLRLVRKDGWEWAERTNAKGVVCICALTEQGEILVIEQFRRPVDARVIELPAGLVGDDGDPNEDGSIAAARELEEETGYVASSCRFVFEGPSSAGMSRETIAFYVAEGCQKRSAGGGVAGEDITTTAVPEAELHDWLAERLAAGVLVDPKVYTGLYWLAKGIRR